MSTLIVYASTHGFTEMCAHRIARQLPGKVETVDLSTHPHPDLNAAKVMVVGGSIHLGAIQPVIGDFCEHHRDALLRRPLALFLSCMKRDEEAFQQLDNAFALRLRAHAFATAILGGALYFDRMSMLQRWVVRHMIGVNDTVEDLNRAALDAFTRAIAHEIEHSTAMPATSPKFARL